MSYAVKEIFLTLQGEGAHAGRASVFCRFAGCNLWSGREADRQDATCKFCDTDFVGTDGTLGGRYASASELAETIAAQWTGAAGNRYILGTEPLWMGDIARILKTTFGPRGYRVPTRRLPYWVMWLNARVDRVVRLALDYHAIPLRLELNKAQRELGWKPRPAEESIVAAAESLIRHNIVPV